MPPKEVKQAVDAKEQAERDAVLYNKNLRADIETNVNERPRALVHSREWAKIMAGEPVEINPAVGFGYKIMSVAEWSARWKRNDDFPDCLNCGSLNTKEHHFIQVGVLAWLATLACLNRPLTLASDKPLLFRSLQIGLSVCTSALACNPSLRHRCMCSLRSERAGGSL